MKKKYLLLGCGDVLTKRIKFPASTDPEYPHQGSPEADFSKGEVTTVDMSPRINADIKADLNILPYDWAADEAYDEIHAYEILEHTGSQGDAEFFFGQFNEFWRMLKPNGFMMISVPMWDVEIAFGVPDHKRVMPAGLFGFLTKEYYENVGKPGFGDYRHLLKDCYWYGLGVDESETQLHIVLQKA